jgi:hypothetical protein
MTFLIAKSENKKFTKDIFRGFLVSLPSLLLIIVSSILYSPNYLKIPKIISLLVFGGIVLISSLALLILLRKFTKR